MVGNRLLGAAAVALCVQLSASGARAEADPIRDTLGPRAVALGEALQSASLGAIATNLNPAGLALGKSYVLEAAVGFHPESEAKIVALSACDSVTARVGACLFYSYAQTKPGDTDARVHNAGLTVALPIGESLFLGVTNRYVDSTITSDDSRFLADGGLILKIARINLGLTGYNLVGADDQQFRRAYGAGAAVFATSALALFADGRWNRNERGRYGTGIEYFINNQGQQGYPVRVGYIYDDEDSGASHITGGVGLVSPRIAVDVGLRRQISQGSELVVELGIRLFVPN